MGSSSGSNHTGGNKIGRPRSGSPICLSRMITDRIGPLHDPVAWYEINYPGTQVTQWDYSIKGTCTSPARLSFVFKVPLCNLRVSIIYSVPCDRIVQRAYWTTRSLITSKILKIIISEKSRIAKS